MHVPSYRLRRPQRQERSAKTLGDKHKARSQSPGPPPQSRTGQRDIARRASCPWGAHNTKVSNPGLHICALCTVRRVRRSYY